MVSCYFTMRDGVQHPDSRGQTMSWRFLACAAVFVTCLLTANVIAAKLVVIAGVVLPAGVVIFPVSYIVADVLTEVWGYSAARRVIWLGFACNLLMVAAIWVGGELPAAAFWRGQPAYVEILGQTPRLLAASFVAYLVGEFANAYVMARMKVLTSGRWLWTRTIGSTIVGEGLDSVVFIVLAFGGAMPAPALFGVILAQWTVKVVYEAAATPITYAVVAWLKGREGLDTYDVSTDFNPMQL